MNVVLFGVLFAVLLALGRSDRFVLLAFGPSCSGCSRAVEDRGLQGVAPMDLAKRKTCANCQLPFRAAARNAWHQRYCMAPACRAASKTASQQRWRAKPENRDYFRGPDNVARVRTWREQHPGHGGGPASRPTVAAPPSAPSAPLRPAA